MYRKSKIIGLLTFLAGFIIFLFCLFEIQGGFSFFMVLSLLLTLIGSIMFFRVSYRLTKFGNWLMVVSVVLFIVCLLLKNVFNFTFPFLISENYIELFAFLLVDGIEIKILSQAPIF